MNITSLVSAGIMALMAGTAMSQTLDPVRVEMFRSILKGNECTLTEAAAGNILPRFDFTKEETRAIVGALVAAGEVRLDGSTLNLIDGSCEAEDPVAALLGQRDVQQFIAVMAENSCAMSEADAEAIFTARGISKSQVGAVVGPMIQAGMATFEGGVLTVDAAYCSPVVVEAEAATAPMEVPELDRSGMFGLGRVRGLVDAMAQNNCMLNMEVADGYLAGAGIEHSFAQFIGRKMLKDGYATMVDDENLVLSAPYCVSESGTAPVVVAEEPPVEDAGVDMAQVDLMRQIFAENGCRLSEARMGELLPAAGFSRASAGAVFNYLEASGELSDVDNDAVLTGDYCAEAQAEPARVPVMVENDGTPKGAMLATAAQSGCALNVEADAERLAQAGVRMDQAYRIVDDLILDGKASLTNGGAMVILDPSICGGSTGQSAAVEPIAQSSGIPASPEGVMIAMMRRNSCSMSLSDARAQFPVLGVPVSAFDPLLQEYIQDGKIQASVDGQTLNFVDPMCYPTPGATDLTDERVDGYVADREAASAQMEALLAENQARIVAAMEAQGGEAQVEADPRAGVLAMLAANGCEVTQGNAAELVAAAGLDFNTSMQILTQMMASGEATSPDVGQTLQVSAPLCVATNAEPMTPRAAFIDLIKRNNCSITAAEFSSLLPANGLDASTALGMIGELEAEGVISLPATRDVVTLSAEMCR